MQHTEQPSIQYIANTHSKRAMCHFYPWHIFRYHFYHCHFFPCHFCRCHFTSAIFTCAIFSIAIFTGAIFCIAIFTVRFFPLPFFPVPFLPRFLQTTLYISLSRCREIRFETLRITRPVLELDAPMSPCVGPPAKILWFAEY